MTLTLSLTNGGTAYLRAPFKDLSFFSSMSEEGVTPFFDFGEHGNDVFFFGGKGTLESGFFGDGKVLYW